MNRLNFITLATRDLSRSRKFFFDLFGWKPTRQDHKDIAFFDMGGWIFGLYPWEHLAKDAKVSPKGNGFRGFTLSHNVPEREDVATVLDRAVQCGGELVKESQEVFWGGQSGYFKDLDGNLWEVAWNPYTPVTADGLLEITAEEYEYSP